ncbi:putative ATPase/DNA-binding SARP family transcriptional activator [Nocardioides cavernae]|uniref:Putative ATPase/DNA-binding SARP family transcriptional activator n=1 Tax=Nocardioides cavernae TaxID=1921566 RepID=A0A7Y9H5B8_9ACTN|nr:BTAD domain-containing putative transcriptional regulator [Nocardioides cavernae]NYE38177.1 putative ATPase/DNA-binding SARP family transcriptional activator [Nocardioides cavernae]
MSIRLRLLDTPTWEGAPIVGARLHALLAALVMEPRGLSVAQLIEQVWEDEPPATPGKALQVLVSRARSATAAEVVHLTETGYRLGLEPDEVDVLALGLHVGRARELLAAGDAVAAGEQAELVRAWPEPATDRAGSAAGPLARLRTLASRTLDAADDLLGRALARQGRHAEALPLLEAAAARWGDDASVLADLLRTMAAIGGPAVALGRYEAHRVDLAERLGIDPAPELQRLHRELLAADDPVRTGLRYDGEGLLGREQDLARLRSAIASSRLVTILGPGGIGKTSVAQVLARESALPHVHVVELVGVGAGDDVVVAVGAALGVRGSVTARRTLTPAQQADVRTRLAQELDAGPTLLVLDNCEHVLEPVAALVAYLLATTRDLQVLTTSRAPLRLAVERAVPLSQLTTSDAEDLFVRRAQATRPDVVLDPAAVRAVVDRLDGLPLAVELAAARVRTMTAAEVAAALDDRFATLRSRDRSTPDRHRTLEAVIAWSWDLLTDDEQRALAWLSLFQDGFDRAAATAVLGRDGTDLVDTLVEQSLLVLTEDGGVARFRALETIREYAAARLVARGEVDAATEAQQRWARGLADRAEDLVLADDQVILVDVLVREQNNLTDVLRHALATNERELVARLVSLLGSLWTVTGDQPRVFAICDAAVDVLTGWEVPDGLHRHAQDAAGVLMIHLSWMPGVDLEALRALLVQGGPPTGTWGLVAHTVHVAEDGGTPAGLARVAARQTRPAMAGALLLWAAIVAENAGDVDTARRHAEEALRRPLPPYLSGSLHAELGQLAMTAGDHRRAARHAEVAWPLLERIHSVTDAYSLQVATAMAPLLEGRVEEAQRLLDRFGPPDGDQAQMGARLTWHAAQAELALARGDVTEALERYDATVDLVTDLDGAPGASPWLAIAASAALVARVRHAADGPDPRADELRDLVAGDGAHRPPGTLWFTDLPLNGVLLVALGSWVLRHGPADQHEDAVRLLAVAHRWSYNRSIPVMAWDSMVALADTALPGRVDRLVEELADRPGPELLPEVAATVERLQQRWVTSSG